MSIELVMPSNHLILCCCLLLLPSVFPSIKVFSNELALQIRWPKFGVLASVFPVNIQGWLPLGLTGLTPCNPRDSQESSSAPWLTVWTLWRSAFFMVQLWHPYMTTGKTIALTRWTLVGKVMSLYFSTLSRFVIAFLPRSKCLLISTLQSHSLSSNSLR